MARINEELTNERPTKGIWNARASHKRIHESVNVDEGTASLEPLGNWSWLHSFFRWTRSTSILAF